MHNHVNQYLYILKSSINKTVRNKVLNLNQLKTLTKNTQALFKEKTLQSLNNSDENFTQERAPEEIFSGHFFQKFKEIPRIIKIKSHNLGHNNLNVPDVINRNNLNVRVKKFKSTFEQVSKVWFEQNCTLIAMIVVHDQFGNKLSPQNKSCIVPQVAQFIAVTDDRNLNLGKIMDLSHLDDHYKIRSCKTRTKNFKINFPKRNTRCPRPKLEGNAGEVIPLSPINIKVPIQKVVAGKKLVDYLQEFFPSEPGNESRVSSEMSSKTKNLPILSLQEMLCYYKNQNSLHSVPPSNYFLYMYLAGLQTV